MTYPLGTDDYTSQPCPVGYVCPWGSASPVACPPGSYSNSTKAELIEECHPCPSGTFNHLYAQKACFPCGSSSISSQGDLINTNSMINAESIPFSKSCPHYDDLQ